VPALLLSVVRCESICRLIGEWLEEMEIASIDEREVDRRTIDLESPAAGPPPKRHGPDRGEPNNGVGLPQ
jgi:hypothetical protein